jgi:hypothetical protein
VSYGSHHPAILKLRNNPSNELALPNTASEGRRRPTYWSLACEMWIQAQTPRPCVHAGSRASRVFFRSFIILSFHLLQVFIVLLSFCFFIFNLFHRGFELSLYRTRGYFWLWSGTSFVSDAAAKYSARVCFRCSSRIKL